MNKRLVSFRRFLVLFLPLVALFALVFSNQTASASTTNEGLQLMSLPKESNPLHAAAGETIPLELLDSDHELTAVQSMGPSGPHYETGAFVPDRTLSVYASPRNSQPISGLTYAPGEVIYYDSYYVTCEDDYCAYGRVFISYISNSGVRRYVPIRPHSYKVYGDTWGYFLY